jgi:hypothetical protein
VTSSRNGATILEADSDEVARWLATDENQHRLCEAIGSNTVFRHRTYNIMALNVPLALDPANDDHRLEICEANNLDRTAITSIKWAKAINKCSPTQRTAHLLLTFNNADAANRAITSGIDICNRRCYTEKAKSEPIRCLKCQGWNHLAWECMEEHDKCSNCRENHRASDCKSDTKYCVSCRSKDHASWSRTCPVFLKKTDEFNSRNPDNSLQFFPTADPWTWTSSFNLNPYPTVRTTATTQKQEQKKTSEVQAGKQPERRQRPPPVSQRSQQNRRRYDTYIPGNTYIPSHVSNLFNVPEQSTLEDWWANPGSSTARPPTSNSLGGGSGSEPGPGPSMSLNRDTATHTSNNA